jgi:hypothetical protein
VVAEEAGELRPGPVKAEEGVQRMQAGQRSMRTPLEESFAGDNGECESSRAA